MIYILVRCDKCCHETALRFDTENDCCADAKVFLNARGWTFTPQVGSSCVVSCPACSPAHSSAIYKIHVTHETVVEIRRSLLTTIYGEILLRCVKRLQGEVVRNHCLNCPIVRQINGELYDSGYSIHYKATEPHTGDFIHYKLLRNNGEILAAVYGK